MLAQQYKQLHQQDHKQVQIHQCTGDLKIASGKAAKTVTLRLGLVGVGFGKRTFLMLYGVLHLRIGIAIALRRMVRLHSTQMVRQDHPS